MGFISTYELYTIQASLGHIHTSNNALPFHNPCLSSHSCSSLLFPSSLLPWEVSPHSPSLPTPPSLCGPLSIAYRSLRKGFFNRSMGTTPVVIPLRKTSLPLQTSINCISSLREGWGLMNPSLLCTSLVQLRADMQKPCTSKKIDPMTMFPSSRPYMLLHPSLKKQCFLSLGQNDLDIPFRAQLSMVGYSRNSAGQGV